MRIQLSDPRREDGAIAIIVALFAVILIVVAAFTTDFGMAYAQRQALATGADSAALAVIRAEHKSQLANLTRTCAAALAQDAALASASPAKASTIALAQVNANAPFSATIAASDVTTTLSCVSGGAVLQVAVVVNRTMSPILGSVVGASPMQLSRQAKAALGVVNGAKNMSPITICINQAQDIITKHLADVAASQADRAQLVPLDKVWGSGTSCDGGGGTGNWGWLDFGGGVGVQNLVDYLTGAYQTTLTLDNSTTPASYTMNGTPGVKNAHGIRVAMNTIMDQITTLPVYSSIGGSGSGTTYKIIGFLSVKMCGYDNRQFGRCYDSSPAVKMTGNDIQIRYVDYIPAGQMGEVCPIGSPCASNAYITKLLR